MLASLYYFDKKSRRTFNQHLPFQSMRSNSKVECERCSRLIKKTLVRRNSIVVVHFVRFEQIFTPCLSALMAALEEEVNVQRGIQC